MKQDKIITMARLAIKLLCILDFVTFGLIHDRLVYQGEEVIRLVKEYYKESKNE